MRGWLKKSLFPPKELLVVDPDPDRQAEFQSLGVEILPAIPSPPPRSFRVLWAVKPQILLYLLREQARNFPGSLQISIAAGISVHQLKEASSARSHGLRWVRAMPNQPVVVGQGVTGLYSPDDLSKSEREEIEGMFAAQGEVFWVKEEDQLHIVTALSGSGPAYVALFAEAMEDAGVLLGLSREVARRLVFRTILGAVSQMMEEGISPSQLKERVTSPGGTTARALFAMDQGCFRGVVEKAIYAAWERSQELGKGG